MARPPKLLEEVNMNISNEEKKQREEAKEELFKYEELSTDPPEWFPASARSEWERLVPVMKKDFPLTETDYGLLVSYCLAFSRVKTAENEIRKYGNYITNENTGVSRANPAIGVQDKAMKTLKSSASALGMTLEARQRLALNKAKQEPKEEDPFKELMKS